MKNRVTELLNIKYPIICGAMGAVSEPELVAAVSEAGGMGVLQTAGLKGEVVRAHVKRTKELTDKPFGVNIAIISGNAKEVFEVIVDEGIKFMTTGAGDPVPLIGPAHEHGIVIFPVVPSARVAKKMQDNGADGVVVEGMEAGGHVGEATTMTLTRMAVKAVDIPVIAAGGIGDGHGVVAAYALGAEGVQVGTAFVASKEAPIHENYKQAVVDATDTSTTIIGREVGAPIRVEKNQGAQDHVDFIAKNADAGVAVITKNELRLLSDAVKIGDREKAVFTYGQIAGLIDEVRPVKDIIEDMFTEAAEVIDSLSAFK